VSGRYKRNTQFWLFGIGLFLAVTLNVNSYRITERLLQDKELRQAVAAQSEIIMKDQKFRDAMTDSTKADSVMIASSRALSHLHLPIGWTDPDSRRGLALTPMTPGAFLTFWGIAFLGFIPTALAVTLGAPFWFDVLNKIMVIRATVKPHQKSPEESSEDKQSGAKSSVTVGLVRSSAPTTVPVGATATLMNAAAAVAVGTLDPDHVPHEWATGDPDEGII